MKQALASNGDVSSPPLAGGAVLARPSVFSLPHTQSGKEEYMLLLSFIFDILNISDARELRKRIAVSIPGPEVCTVVELLVQHHTVVKNTLGCYECTKVGARELMVFLHKHES